MLPSLTASGAPPFVRPLASFARLAAFDWYALLSVASLLPASASTASSRLDAPDASLVEPLLVQLHAAFRDAFSLFNGLPMPSPLALVTTAGAHASPAVAIVPVASLAQRALDLWLRPNSSASVLDIPSDSMVELPPALATRYVRAIAPLAACIHTQLKMVIDASAASALDEAAWRAVALWSTEELAAAGCVLEWPPEMLAALAVARRSGLCE